MRICFFADGQSIHTVRWCEYFQARGHEVHLITFPPAEIPNVFVHVVDGGKIEVNGGNGHLITRFRKVRRILKQINPDIFHALYATSYGVTGALAGHKNYIISALGSDLLLSGKASWIYKKALRFAFRKTKWIIVMSEQMSEAAKEIGAEMSKVKILPFGVDPTVFNSSNKQLSSTEFVITSTRNFEKVYNIPLVLNAVKRLKDEIPNLRLNLFGSGSMTEEVKQLIIDLELTEVVSFRGKMKQIELAQILKDSHVYVSVSLSDGSSNCLNEAVGCDVFCVVTDLPANTPWVKDGLNGLLVKTGSVDDIVDKIRMVHQNYSEYQGKASPVNRQVFEERGIWSNNMKLVEDKYAEILKK